MCSWLPMIPLSSISMRKDWLGKRCSQVEDWLGVLEWIRAKGFWDQAAAFCEVHLREIECAQMGFRCQEAVLVLQLHLELYTKCVETHTWFLRCRGHSVISCNEGSRVLREIVMFFRVDLEGKNKSHISFTCHIAGPYVNPPNSNTCYPFAAEDTALHKQGVAVTSLSFDNGVVGRIGAHRIVMFSQIMRYSPLSPLNIQVIYFAAVVNTVLLGASWVLR